MSEYIWMCLYKQDSEYALDPQHSKILNRAKSWKWQDSQYLNILNMPEYALTESWIYLGF